MEQEELLKKIADILARLKIPYIVTGGIAVVVWGRPRFTADIDIMIELMADKLDQLAEELSQIDTYVYADKMSMRRALLQKGEFNFIHSASGLKIDFWIMKDDQFNRECLKRRIRKVIANTPIFLTTPEDLILSKLLWYRKTESTRQLEDIESVMKIQKKLDWKYINKWAKIQLTDDVLKSIKKNKKHEST